ncbi:MAG: Oligopeptide transport ATP-binding protein OppD [Candidatus Izimaplasma bacterium HR2]|nr:MAG: Oligopeptide transport ATP-binding protein OppD [Candidatus Izimaplasma bacterium HR2]
MAGNIKLHVEDLTISFKTTQGLVRAVRGVSFDLHEGETLAIVGESGSGKSVTSRTIMGILAGNGIIDDGKIIYEGEDLTKVDEDHFHEIRGNKIGMIFQDPMSSLNPIMKIGKQVTEGMILNGKHLENRYKALFHEAKTTLNRLHREKKSLKVELRANLKAIKTGDSSADGMVLKEECNAALAKVKIAIPAAKKRLVVDKKAAKVAIDLEWKNEQERVTKLVSDVKAKLADSDGEAKQAYVDEIDMLQENLKRFKKVTKRQATERAIEIMDEVGIPDPVRRLNQYPFQFSGGMRQRIVIAIALTASPDVLICDEPTTALDVTIQSQILELINDLKRERNLSVIFITHDLGVVANMADRIGVMYAGKLVELGTAEDVFYNPVHPYTWALLSSMPDLESKERLTAIPGTPPNMLFPPVGDAFADRNSYAMAIDFKEQPPMFKVSETHSAATWLLHPDAPKVEMPEVIRKRIDRMTKNTSEVSK